MQDSPNPAEILNAVARFLRDVVQPQLSGREAFDNRVAVNALDVVRRQMQQASNPASDPEVAEHARLVALLGRDGSLEELNRVLCQRIAAGEVDLTNTEFVAHLRATTLAKLAIDQPTYPGYERALRQWSPD